MKLIAMRSFALGFAFLLAACGQSGGNSSGSGMAGSENGSGSKSAGGASNVGGARSSSGGAANVGGSAAVTGGQSGGGGSVSGGQTGVGGGGAVSDCPAAPTARLSNGGILEFDVSLKLGALPFKYGEANALSPDGTLTPTNVRFYLSEFALLKGADVVPVDLVKADGSVVPHNVRLITLDDPASLAVRVKAPPGEYDGVSFILGLNAACNSVDASKVAPLDDASQMAWPHTFGFLFFRYEADVTGSATVLENTPAQIHMGGIQGLLAPKFRLTGKLHVDPAGSKTNLVLAFDQVLKASLGMTTPTGVPLPPGPEVKAGEALRQNAEKFPLFSLALKIPRFSGQHDYATRC
ncbi:MAG: MbnP family protein [Polyangiaceae bacterium]|nr:MbnP family protein [Polyangiaceae bacterium]